MHRVVLGRTGAAVMTGLMHVALAAQAPAEAPPPEPFTRVCGNCHSPERIVSSRRSRDQWQEVVDNMVGRGAQGTDADLFAVMKYLVGRHGRVNINRATADDIVEVLAIATTDAQKIVDFRKANGKFEDMDALVKVPGIDAEKIKNQREAVAF